MRLKLHILTICLSVLLGLSQQALGQCTCTSGVGDQTGLQLYWVGTNSDNYNDACNWRLNNTIGTEVPCQAPRSGDDVFFMDAAFSGASNIIRIDQNSNCKNMTWEDAIQASKGVSLQGINNGVSLDIYGSLALATNMTVSSFNGLLRFGCTQPQVVTLETKGQNLRLDNLYINLGANAELRLVDKLTVNNQSNNNVTSTRKGGIIFNSGHFNTNGQDLNLDMFYSRSGISNRQLTIDNSYINLNVESYGYSGWTVDFNASNNAGVSATGSHIHIDAPANNGTVQYISLGSSMTYDSITVNHGMGRVRLYPACNITCQYFEVAAETVPLYGSGSTIRTTDFKIGANAFAYQFNLYTDNFYGPTACETAVMHNVRLEKLTTGGVLNINNIVAQNVDAITTGGNTYAATTCYDAGNCSNITFNAVSSCNSHLRFRDAGNQDWHDVANWVDATTGLPATHIPTPWTDVYFVATSFPNLDKVDLTNTAFCRNMRWINTPANADLRLLHHLFLGGTIELDTNMAAINEGRIGHEYGRGIICMSSNNDSLITKGIRISSGVQLMDHSNYHVIDTLSTSLFMKQGGNGHVYFRDCDIEISNYIILPGATTWENASMNYTGGGWTGISISSAASYTNSTFYLNNTGNLMVSSYMPNVVVNGPGAVFAHTYIGVRGDLTINSSSLSSMKDFYGYTSYGRIDVSGDVHIKAGVNVTLNSNTGSYMRVQGNVYTTGSCSAGLTSIRSDVGDPIEFRVNGTGSNLDGTFLQGLDASSGQALTANNSTDGGNNSNISFVVGAGQTFYWVEDMTAPGDLVGNWSDPNHWTTTMGKVNGDGTCIPSIEDDVVFARNNASCTIDGSAFCNNLSTTSSNVTLASTSGNNGFYVAGGILLEPTTINNYTGILNMVGSGNINTNGVGFVCKELNFNKVGGVWNLQSDISLNRNTTNTYYNLFILAAGTVNANGYDIFVKHRFISNSNNDRALDLTGSTFQIGGTANYNSAPRYLWDASNSANLTINGGFIHVMAGNSDPDKAIHWGNGNISYDSVLVEIASGADMRLLGTGQFGYAEFNGGLVIEGNNSYDTLVFNGGHTYKFTPNRTQTLNAPHGKLISKNVGPSNSINLESTITAQLAYIHKEYGNSFCLNYIKVKDVQATKAAAQPAACTLPDCWDLLEFQTDQNSDSISIPNNDWGIWRFKLAPLVNPVSSGTDTVIICKTGASLSYPIEILGTSPYIIDYSWEDATNAATNGGETGILVNDDDDNPNTPFIYNVPLNPIVNRFNYTVDIATSRCGSRILSTPVQTHVIVPVPEPLVATQRTGSCVFENEGAWYAILDDQDERPIVSLLDSTGVTDDDSLGLVNVEVFFEPSVGILPYNSGTPYLQRHWQIDPTNNKAAKVRLYFTQAELDALSVGTYYGGNLILDPATELMVLKYENGTYPGSLTPTVVAHTVVAQNGIEWTGNPAAAAPFSTTTGMIAIEFDVTGFSHFAIVPTESALLNAADLLSFDAKLANENTVQTNWTIETTRNIKRFTVQQTRNYIEIADKGTLAIVQGQLEYGYLDSKPMVGDNYYRLKITDNDGSISYSDWKVVNIQGAAQAIVYPNPASEQLNVQLYTEQATTLQLTIVSTLGETVRQSKKTVAVGMETINLSIEHLAVGTYILLLEDSGTGITSQHRFTKK